jgi:hypothetical protein
MEFYSSVDVVVKRVRYERGLLSALSEWKVVRENFEESIADLHSQELAMKTKTSRVAVIGPAYSNVPPSRPSVQSPSQSSVLKRAKIHQQQFDQLLREHSSSQPQQSVRGQLPSVSPIASQQSSSQQRQSPGHDLPSAEALMAKIPPGPGSWLTRDNHEQYVFRQSLLIYFFIIQEDSKCFSVCVG